MPQHQTDPNQSIVTPHALVQPVQVLCGTGQPESKQPPTDRAPDRPTEEEELGRDQLHPPGRTADEVMRAFREQRRLTQAEGESGAVIAQILARAGRGSLAADLARRE